ncbi:methylamine utilization protein [Prochlorococcus phage P-SSM2]|jgi:hypothetical protein|uniref:Methylamine utilization protein n=2 Tax=Salacisavirus pssm2 TaxID=2734140 RepID=Q58ML1_BPPRM|nr:methylamine utilization [Prochlorococcus phage P-SSM2]AAX44521.1 methylamine utilization protein [Prochlorococcus phage P-SSM2]ACY76022.1 conserved hypothetical protein [Prochlorococcus phage P-SSM2]AGN12446.1 hypothetical protein PRTG_00298 [Prochlorococcus phage P-SSM5]|tara:strand:+ start:166 stop:579 length:414 start_codon:yes stop_codon:yes gene_type:complete
MGEEFYGVIKLVTGEEIFALISVEENDHGNPVVLVQTPVVMKVLSHAHGQYVKIKPWLELADEDMYLINYDRVVTMTQVKDSDLIGFYERYLKDDEVDIELDGKVKLHENMGFISTVDDARKKLEDIFKNTNKPEED